MILNKLIASPSTLACNLLKPSNVIQLAERCKGNYWGMRPKELQNVRKNSLRKYLMREHKKKAILKRILRDEYILANTW